MYLIHTFWVFFLNLVQHFLSFLKGTPVYILWVPDTFTRLQGPSCLPETCCKQFMHQHTHWTKSPQSRFIAACLLCTCCAVATRSLHGCCTFAGRAGHVLRASLHAEVWTGALTLLVGSGSRGNSCRSALKQWWAIEKFHLKESTTKQLDQISRVNVQNQNKLQGYLQLNQQSTHW